MSNRKLIDRLKEASSNAPNHAILRDSADALEAMEWQTGDAPFDIRMFIKNDDTGEIGIGIRRKNGNETWWVADLLNAECDQFTAGITSITHWRIAT